MKMIIILKISYEDDNNNNLPMSDLPFDQAKRQEKHK